MFVEMAAEQCGSIDNAIHFYLFLLLDSQLAFA